MTDSPAMEDIHGVDVSWLHHSKRGTSSLSQPHRFYHGRDRNVTGNTDSFQDRDLRLRSTSSPGLPKDPPPQHSHNNGVHPPHNGEVKPPLADPPTVSTDAPAVTLSQPPHPNSPANKALPKRPGLLNRGSSEKVPQTSESVKTPPRRNSWMSNITSKFSSGSPQPQQNGMSPKPVTNGLQAIPQGKPAEHVSSEPPHTKPGQRGSEEMEPYVPQTPKSGSSFFSNALRRLSTSSTSSLGGKVAGTGGMCPRRVMNIDPNRPRVLIPELDQNKLRRVAFCVDVEIAGGPKYKDDVSEAERKRKFKEKKLKEKGEGAALKNPQAAAEEKDKDDFIHESCEQVGTDDAPNPEGTIVCEDKEKSDKKKEKKKKSEEERKARKEEKRRKAEECGSVPMLINRDAANDDDASSTTAPTGTSPGTSAPTSPRHSDRPTTDPLRIYRRCCQLRETPILKRITEQLARPEVCPAATPGIVSTLDLTGSRLTLADVVTLSDWLAVVPVKKLLMEDAELSDEGVRVMLAGLLAAVKPDSPRSRPHRNGSNPERYEERCGVIEKLSLKNNPKITKEGWKHISLFIYMCKSIKALDMSMIFFPSSPAPAHVNGHHDAEGEVLVTPSTQDCAETFSKALSERLGGSRLEELILAECALTAHDIRKIIDGVIISGVSRLVIASNGLDDEGLESVLRYVHSGVCQGIDLGGNDLRNQLGKLAAALTPETPLWALSLADCDLEPTSLKSLWPALSQLPNLRFLDFSHNPELFTRDPSALTGFRKYLPHLKMLKRLHLIDVNMSPAQAIALAEIIPESPSLCHINILQNPQLSALASATEEEQQEEGCALYASLMVAARVSQTLICVDIDVPSADNSEVVKALAKQVVAYCLRNIENFTAREIQDATGAIAAANGAEVKETKEIKIPDVLLHLVGQSEGQVDPNADDARDEDYIVGGNGVIKALSYCLSEKASDSRRKSLPPSGTATPTTNQRMASIAERELGAGGAKDVSKNLLDSARKIRERLQPALVREAKQGDDMAYRRLLFLDNTLKGVIQRFEDEYPETRLPPADSTKPDTISEASISPPSSLISSAYSKGPPSSTEPSIAGSTVLPADSDEEAEEDEDTRPTIRSRHNSDVSLAARALAIEEGQAHKLGVAIKRTFLKPQSEDHLHNTMGSEEEIANEPDHIKALRAKLESLSGEEWKRCVEEEGFEGALRMVEKKAEGLRKLREDDPEEFGRVERMIRQRWEEVQGGGDVAVED